MMKAAKLHHRPESCLYREPLMNPSGSFTVIEVAGIGRLAERLRLNETLSRRQRCRVNEFA